MSQENKYERFKNINAARTFQELRELSNPDNYSKE